MRLEWQCLKRYTGDAGFWAYGLGPWTLESWTLDDWTLGLWTLGLGTTVRLDSGLLDAWTLDNWTLGLWTYRARKFFPFLVTSISFLLLVNYFQHLTIDVLWFCWTCCEWLLYIIRTCYNWYYNLNSQIIGSWKNSNRW